MTRQFSGPTGLLRVLIVDDEPRLRDMLSRSTAEMGFAPATARSAEQARRLLESEPVDILLLDLNLPGQDGMDLLEQLRSMPSCPQVIILTGFGSLEAAKRAIRLDVVDFLTKPCSLDDLEIALNRARQRLRESVLPRIDPDPEPQVEPTATLEDLERVHILAALDRNHGNRAATAVELGISERTLYYRLSQYQRLSGLESLDE
jgi:DNA-binding NtrC family response regulator